MNDDLVDYKKSLDSFDNLVVRCTDLSTNFSGIYTENKRFFYASVLFTRLCNMSVSLLMLLPRSKRSIKQFDHWDYSTVASIARDIAECYLMFYYLCIDSVDSEDEWMCRWNLVNLHDCMARKRIFEKLKETEQMILFDKEAENLRERLLKNPYFCSMPDKVKKELLKGKSAFLFNQDEIIIRLGLSKESFRLMYELMSLHTHSLPFSFYRMSEGNRGRGLYSETEEKYTIIFLELASEFLNYSYEQYNLICEKMVSVT